MKHYFAVLLGVSLVLSLLPERGLSRVYRYRHHKLSEGARQLLESPEEEGLNMITPLDIPNPYMMQLMATYNPTNIYHPLHPFNPMNMYQMMNPMFQGPLGLPGTPYMESYMIDMDQEKLRKLNSDNNLEVDRKIMDDQLKTNADNSQDELNKNLYKMALKTLA